jgi:hypothetical protein
MPSVFLVSDTHFGMGTVLSSWIAQLPKGCSMEVLESYVT